MNDVRSPVVVSGHQPTYLPWLGLFHKIALCDIFIFMDDVQYLTGDWNNRNRVKGSDGPFWLTVPIRRKASSSSRLIDTVIDDSSFGTRHDWQLSHWKSLQSCYRQAPYWDRYAGWLEGIYTSARWTHLSALCETMIRFFLADLGINVRFERASALNFSGRKSDLVLEHCTRFSADICVVGTHGKDYIRTEDFIGRGISLHFQDYKHPTYAQRFGAFVPNLSIVDLLCNHGPRSLEILMSENPSRATLCNLAKRRAGAEVLVPDTTEAVA